MAKFLFIFLPFTALFAQPFDLVLYNGRIIDGTGKPAYPGAIAIRDGRIVAIGAVEGAAKKSIDVKGHVIAPGFIDVHTHAENIEHHPAAKAFLRMGVTTLVLGNCGSSKLDLGAFYKKLEQKGFSPNVCSLIGHGTVRRQAMGASFVRPPTAKELAEMKRHIEKAMRDGAVGMSTGLIYIPGVFAKTDELIELAKVVSAHKGVYVSHMRAEGTKIFEAVDEVCKIASAAKLPAHISHLKLNTKPMWGKHPQLLALLNRARAEGLALTHDQYAYTASSTGLRQLLPDESRAKGRKHFRQLIANPVERKKITDWMKGRLKARKREDYAWAVIASYKHDKSYNGLNIVEAAQKRFGDKSLSRQLDLLIELEANGGASGVFHGMNEADARALMKNPFTMFASDSGVRVYKSGMPHPRGYGNAARFLARYTRDQKNFPLEEAIRKLTYLPASTFKLRGRGAIHKGYAADLVVFDPAKVQDKATFKEPHHYATGFRLVLVNGQTVVENDKHNGAGPGQIIRRGQ